MAYVVNAPAIRRVRLKSVKKFDYRERARAALNGEPANGFYIEPAIFSGYNSMRVFPEWIFAPAVSVTTFKDEEGALSIANDTCYGLGPGSAAASARTVVADCNTLRRDLVSQVCSVIRGDYCGHEVNVRAEPILRAQRGTLPSLSPEAEQGHV